MSFTYSGTSLVLAAGVAYVAYRGLGSLIYSYFLEKTTVVNELDFLGKPRDDGKKIKGTVVIAGGSIGGLWTARVCSWHFERVVVIDPEAMLETKAGTEITLPEVKETGEDRMRAPVNDRPRVSQYNSIHAYQVLALWAMRKAFPNFDTEFKEADGVYGPARFKYLYSGIAHVNFEHLLPENARTVHWVRRRFIEPFIRRLVKKYSRNIEFVVGSVVKINPDVTDRTKIGSVSYKLKDDEKIREEEAVLFVDCSGPMHNGLKWLAEAGYGTTLGNTPAGTRPLSDATITYHPRMCYSTSYWPVTPSQRAELEDIIPGGYTAQRAFFIYLSHPATGNGNCGIGQWDAGGDVVTVMCGGWGNIELPRTPEEIVRYFQGMTGHHKVQPWVYSVLEVLFRSRGQEMFENIKVPQMSRVLYDKLSNLPTNYLAIGDAVMRVNPVYGQGLSKCMMGAMILNRMLHDLPGDARSIPSGFTSRFFKLQEEKVCTPMWDATKTQDYNYKTTTPVKGESLQDGAFVRWYGNNLMLAGSWSSEVALAFNQSQSLLAPPIIFFKPTILAKVLWEGLVHKAK